jgi:MraZ protein
MVFTDAYERTIDIKNRIQIPAQFRAAMDPERDGETFYLCPGERLNTLSLFPERRFYRLAEQLRTEQVSGDDSLEFEQLYYSLASRLEMDKQGRVVLPERQLALVQLGKDITLAGASTRIDIWATPEYREFMQNSYRDKWGTLHKFIRQTLERRADSEAR